MTSRSSTTARRTHRHSLGSACLLAACAACSSTAGDDAGFQGGGPDAAGADGTVADSSPSASSGGGHDAAIGTGSSGAGSSSSSGSSSGAPGGSSGSDGGSSGASTSSSSGSSGGSSGSSSSSGGPSVDAGSGGPAVDSGAGGPCKPATCGSHKWPCWPMPNGATDGLPHPASYTDQGNGTVLDNVTCLTWDKTAGASGASDANIAYCANLAATTFAGYADWRLPTRVEIASILDMTRTSDAINPVFGKQTAGYFRTASDWYETIQMINGSTFGWITSLINGLTSNAYLPASPASALCVRGNGTGESVDQLAVEPPNHYTIAAGEVTDNYTGLVWQQAFSATQMAWSAAAGYCASLGLNGHTWRLPGLNELTTIVDEARVGPAINPTAFPNTQFCATGTVENYYWAREELPGSSFAWGINFCDGFTNYNAATATFNTFPTAFVRCVR